MAARTAWDQLRGEPGEAYNRFLIYRNLGPTRTLLRAYRYYLQTSTDEKAEKGLKRHPPGSWHAEYDRYNWKTRAVAWTRAELLKLGDEIMPLWGDLMRAMLLNATTAAHTSRGRPQNCRDIMTVFAALSPYVTPDVYKAMQSAAAPTTDSGSEQIEAGEAKPESELDKPKDKPIDSTGDAPTDADVE